jgi:hypothetical protein
MSRVADKAGLERTHLYRKLKQLNIRFARRARYQRQQRHNGSCADLLRPSEDDVAAGAQRGAARHPAIGVVFGDIGTSPLYTLRQSSPARTGCRSRPRTCSASCRSSSGRS